jgi:SET domain-containing protein
MNRLKKNHFPLKKAYEIEIKESEFGGYGVFAKEDIPADTILETCPTILLDSPIDYNGQSIINNYVFSTMDSTDKTLLAFGDCSLYNHQPYDKSNSEFNTIYDENLKRYLVQMKTIKPIKKDEEITHDYGDEYWKENTNVTQK